jgi:hypothetical protein
MYVFIVVCIVAGACRVLVGSLSAELVLTSAKLWQVLDDVFVNDGVNLFITRQGRSPIEYRFSQPVIPNIEYNQLITKCFNTFHDNLDQHDVSTHILLKHNFIIFKINSIHTVYVILLHLLKRCEHKGVIIVL